MYATAADLPAELVDRILDFIDPKLIDEEPAVVMTKKELALVGRSCRYWAQRCQSRIFEELILRSAADVHSLLAFLRDDKSCVSRFLHSLILQVYPSRTPSEAWLHVAFGLLPQKAFKSPTVITVKISDQPVQDPKLVQYFKMNQYLAKTVPPPTRLSILRLTDVAFDNFDDLVRLLAHMRPLYTFSCRRVTWKSATTTRSFNLPSTLRRITVSACTQEAHVYQRLLAHHRAYTSRSKSFAPLHVGSIERTSLSFIAEMVNWLDPFTASLTDKFDGHLYLDGSSRDVKNGFSKCSSKSSAPELRTHCVFKRTSV